MRYDNNRKKNEMSKAVVDSDGDPDVGDVNCRDRKLAQYDPTDEDGWRDRQWLEHNDSWNLDPDDGRLQVSRR